MLSVLFLIESPGQFGDLIRFSDLLQASRRAERSFLVYDCDFATARIVEQVQQSGATLENAPAASSGSGQRRAVDVLPGPLRGVLRWIRDLLRPLALVASYRRLLRRRHVNLVVVAEDNVGGRSRALVTAAGRLGIAVLILPYTIPNPEEAAGTLGRLRSHRIRRLDQRVLAALRPAWMRPAGAMKLLRLPVGQAIALELAGLAPKRPWIANCGSGTVALESKAMLDHYRALGCDEKSLVVTGSMADAVLESGLSDRTRAQRALRERLGLDDRPLLLCAFPADQLTTGTATSEFAAYQELVEAWASAFVAVSDLFAIVVKPHPRLAESELAPLRRPNIAIAREDTAALVPLCDLYVASISATIRWAIACGRPVVNYDVHHYRYSDYAGVPGIVAVDNYQAFRRALLELGKSPARLTELAAAQAAVAPEWACLDGKSAERLLALVDRLVAGARKP